jgi:hypothetical protein
MMFSAADLILAATSKVATLHRRACSLSVDLSPDMISATGGCQGFVHWRKSAVRPHPQSAQVRFMRTLLVSDDLTADLISATGGNRRFVPFRENRKGNVMSAIPFPVFGRDFVCLYKNAN